MKIIQILMALNNITWQGKLLGLGDDGNVYYREDCKWRLLAKSDEVE